MSEIKNLKPTAIWKNFYDLTQVPRPSGHLEKVQNFLLDFGNRIGAKAFKDSAGNIVIKKPATPGMENRKTVILQSHMDMVPQKSPDSKHNFETDPIETHIEGDWVYANNTTLGADNGIGVAAIMGVLESKDLKHGPIEALITADEETGMFGANDLPADELDGDILLNLDSETWGEMIIGSAGGVDITANLGYKPEENKDGVALKVTLKGLKGGHSGLEIHEGRGNANKLMARFIYEVIKENGVRLASWHGGNMRNAIPFKAETVIVVPENEVNAVKERIDFWKKEFNEEYRFIEKEIEFFAEEVEKTAHIVPQQIQDNLVSAIYACDNGVIRMIPAIPNIVETSSNLAIIDIEDGNASFKILARSSSEEMKKYICTTIETCLNMAGMKVEFSGSYQGWNPNTDSEILNSMKNIYKDMFKEDAIVQVCHAGLECSIILGKYPKLDVVSFGPTIQSPHTATERCYIPTMSPFWNLLTRVLEEVPVK